MKKAELEKTIPAETCRLDLWFAEIDCRICAQRLGEPLREKRGFPLFPAHALLRARRVAKDVAVCMPVRWMRFT
jgi:hypothetical protein